MDNYDSLRKERLVEYELCRLIDESNGGARVALEKLYRERFDAEYQFALISAGAHQMPRNKQ